MVKPEAKGKSVLKRKSSQRKTPPAEAKRTKFQSDQKSSYAHRRSSRKKGKKNAGIEDDQAQAGASQLFDAYRKWCEEYGIHKPMDGRTFGMKMAHRYPKRHTRNGNVYDGIGLLS